MNSATINNDPIQYPKIESLTDYIKEIIELRERLISDGRSESLFFRGQSNVEWDIRPSIFRNSLVSFEDKIIQKAIARAPFEFNNHSNAFEKLTKLQHYGLPTRLLDVTMNPLVALYFACQPANESLGNISGGDSLAIENDGVVYYSCAYDESIESSRIQLTSSIALKEINKDTTLKKLKEDLVGSSHEIDPSNFISIIQGNYFVKSNHSNDRLVRQSGAFMLTGAITITEDIDDLWHSKVQKSVCSVNSEFSQERFIISGEAKERILDELDFCNINEATLFPELEHQMSHIKRITAKQISDLVTNFVKFESKTNEISFDTSELNDIAFEENTIKTIVNKYVKGSLAIDSILIIIKDAAKFTDWSKKESVLNILVSNIKRKLAENGSANPKETASYIVNELINSI
jgi:hypothetical protein